MTTITGIVGFIVGFILGIAGSFAFARHPAVDVTIRRNTLQDMYDWCRKEAEMGTTGPGSPAYHVLGDVARHIAVELQAPRKNGAGKNEPGKPEFGGIIEERN